MTSKSNVQRASRPRPCAGQRLVVRIALLISLSLAAAVTRSVEAQTSALQGTVSVSSAGGQSERLPGANLSLTPAAEGQAALSAVTDEQGEFKFTNLAAGLYTLRVSLGGFKQHTESVTVSAGVTTHADVALEVEGVADDVTVVADGEGLNATDTAPAAAFKQGELQTLPLVNERFQDALPLVPGVVRGPDGQLNVKGARASQSGLTVNSANVTDPVTGEFAINLPIEAIQSVEVITNPYAPEYGQFTGAVTAVQTRSGTDKFAFDAQSMFPRLRRRGGHFVGIDAFTPRVTFSGPLIKGKLRFIQSFEYRFVSTSINSLPQFKRFTDLESFDSLSQLDWDIGKNDHLTATFSLFPQKLRYVGLNTFNPQEVTPNFKQRGFLFGINERRILNGKSVLESSFSVKQFDADVFPSSGSAPMNLAPDGNSGNFFNRQVRRSKRYQALEVYSFTPPNFGGEHFVKLGGGVSYVTFDGSNTSNTVRVLRADGTRSQQIDFVGGGQLGRNKTEVLAYFEDKWSVNRRLTLEYGVRYDRDSVASENDFAPRVSFALLPLLDGRTVVRGGVGLFYDQIDLNVATFTQLQERVLTRFGPDGEQLVGDSERQRFLFEGARFRTPRSINWNVEVDREWMKNLFVRVGYEQREGRREFVLNPVESQSRGSILELENSGQSLYREFQVTARYKFRERDEFVASYVHSDAEGELNDFNSYLGNFGNAIIRPNERSRLSWDAPHRFLFWGQFQAGYGITLAPVLDVRSGFPYSIIDEERNFVGPRNRAGRFPTFASLDMQATKTVSLPGRWKKYRAHLGLKVFNVLNHFNPRDFQNNLASDDFGAFYNGVGRRFGTRIVFEKK
jgi:hypothetical protein